MECPEHAVYPEALPLREIRKQQRRIAALLQRTDLDIFIPKMRRRPLARRIHVCVCSRLDPEGIYRNAADEFLRQGFRKPKGQDKALLPGHNGLRSKSRSLETLVDADQESTNPEDDESGSWTNRDLHRIVVPRMDPFGQRYNKGVDVIRPRDIENFEYAKLKKEDELVLPPIPRRAPLADDRDGGDGFGARQLSVTMFVPDNTPVSTANNERSSRDSEAKGHGATKAGGRPRTERSLSNFISQFGDIKEEAGDRRAYGPEFAGLDDSSRDDASANDEEGGGDSGVGENAGRASGRTGGGKRQSSCMCSFPDWQEVTPAGQGRGVVLACMKCGLRAPLSGPEAPRERRKRVDVLEIQHEDDDDDDSADDDGDDSPSRLGDRNAVVNRAGGSSRHDARSLHGFSRQNAADSLEFRRASIASSLSEISEGTMEQAWREKLANDANIRDGFLATVEPGSRQHSDAPSLTITSYGQPSQPTDQDVAHSPAASPTRRTRFRDDGDDDDEQNSGRKPRKKLSFFRAPDGTSVEDEGHFVLGSEMNKRRKRRGGILRNFSPPTDDEPVPKEVAPLAEPSEEVPLERIPKRAYEKALARAQIENHPDDHGLLYLRLTDPYKFSYFEPLTKVCPCCNKTVDDKKTTNNKKKPPEGKDKKGKKEKKKKKTKRFNEMKHIFGSVSVYDYYPGGKYNLQ